MIPNWQQLFIFAAVLKQAQGAGKSYVNVTSAPGLPSAPVIETQT